MQTTSGFYQKEALNLPQTLPESHKEIELLSSRVYALENMIFKMRREKFGRKTEQVIYNDQQLNFEIEGIFFNEPEVVATSEDTKEIEITFKRNQTKKACVKDLPIDEEIIVDIPESEKMCADHKMVLQQVGTKEVIKIEKIPSQRKVIKFVYPIYGSCSDFCIKEKISAPDNDILSGSIATPSLLSDLIISKFENALPLYRIEKIWNSIGISLTRATMARWLISLEEKFSPLINLMSEDLKAQGYFQCDETSVQVLTKDGVRTPGKSFMWVRYAPLKPIVIYDYQPSRQGIHVKPYLEDFKGYIQVDGYTGYNVVSEFSEVTELGCWAHTRRYFFDAYEEHKSPKAFEMLKLIKKLFSLDAQASTSLFTRAQRHELRQKESRPVIEKIKEWIDKNINEIPPKSPLGVAINYTHNQWKNLIIFLEDERLELSTNLVENKIRPFTIGRKNWLFFDSEAGAKAGSTLYSLIETAKAHNLNTRKYFTKLLAELPKAQTLEQIEKLLPLQYKIGLSKKFLRQDGALSAYKIICKKEV